MNATASLSHVTPDDRAAMMRVLADRFRLDAHLEKRQQSVLALVLARKDGAIGAGLTKIDTDCVATRRRRPSGGRGPDCGGQPAASTATDGARIVDHLERPSED